MRPRGIFPSRDQTKRRQLSHDLLKLKVLTILVSYPRILVCQGSLSWNGPQLPVKSYSYPCSLHEHKSQRKTILTSYC